MDTAAKINVAGAGFAAITGVRELRKQLPGTEITLVAPKPEFVYLPSLIWVPYGIRKGDELRFDILALLEELRVEYVRGSVIGISEDGRTLQTDAGEIENDALLIATGGRYIKKLPGIGNTIIICEGVDAAEKMGERLRAMDGGTIAMGFGGNPREPTAMRGGPMFELLFGLDTWLNKQGVRDRFRLVFFTPAPQPGKRLGAKAVSRILEEMDKRGIETHLGHKLQSFENNIVKTAGGEIPADLILFIPGMTGPGIIDSLDKGMLVYRGEKRSMALPSMRPLHWAKSYLEKSYLRHFR